MRKLTLSLVFVILTAIIGFGWSLDQLFERYATKDAHNDVLSGYTLTGKNLANTLDKLENTHAFIQHWQQQNNSNITLSSIATLPLPKEIKTNFLHGEPIVLASENEISIHYYLPLKKQVLSLTLPPTLQNNTTPDKKLVFTLLFYIGILGLVLLWLYPLIKRLSILSQTAKQFGNGDLSQRIKKSSSSYIADIENEFNRMAQRIESLVKDNKLLSSAVSHDLRTPLARLRFGIDSLAETDNLDTRKKYQARMSNDIAEMESLVEILLDYAKLDSTMLAIKKQTINLNSLLDTCITSVDITDKQIHTQKPGTPSIITGDERYLTLLINNLFSNALYYSKQNLMISLTTETETYTLSVEDDGVGIPLDQQADVLKPFVRGHNTPDRKGFGMGLAIVSRVAKWHNATVHINKSTTLGGAKLSVQFPKEKSL